MLALLFVVCLVLLMGFSVLILKESSKLLSVELLGLVHQTDDSRWRPGACNV